MTGKEKLIFTDEYIKIENIEKFSLVMHRGESPLMKKFAETGCINGGDILEIGFGMGISANYVQLNNIKSHTIIEIHPEIYNNAIEWAKDKKNVKVILGSWETIIPTLQQKFDGILHDTHIDYKSRDFLNYIKPVCRENCVVVFAFFKDNQNKHIYDAEIFKFTNEEYEKLPKYPYDDDPNFVKNHYEIFYTTYKNGEYKKRTKKTKKLF
jgi:guanidinoacetate N-methyltransferase